MMSSMFERPYIKMEEEVIEFLLSHHIVNDVDATKSSL